MPAPTVARLRQVQPDALRRRALAVACLLSVWMFVVAARLIYLQTSQHRALRATALAQQQDDAKVSPQRGLIVDRQGYELARSVETESFFAVPGEVENVDETIARFAQAARANETELQARLRTAKEAKRRFIWLARRLDAEQAARVHNLSLKGIYAFSEPKRFYPNNELAAHVLGFVGLDGDGLAGVERIHNARLAGDGGKLFVSTDARRHAYESIAVEPREGQTVMLTLDSSVQHYAEQALANAIERTRARSATAIVLEPRTGEILALANAPTFDPNAAGKLSPEKRANQALQNIYEPGSTFKIVAFSAAMEEGLASPDEKINCQMGSITVAGRLVHDHHPFGTLTLTEALAKSSNVAAIKLGLRVGDARMYDYITRFGFGARTGIDLPGETGGILRAVKNWQPSSIGSIAIGQEIGVTPLQMAAAFGAIANDGVRVSPHLVREIRGTDGTVVDQASPQSRRVVSADTARKLRGMLESVTLNGTAKLAQLDGYTAAGKTGTAQKIDPQTHAYSSTKFVASFVGFAPVENPSIVIIVVVDEPGGAYHGGDVAAPVFREIAENVLPYLNVMPDTQINSSTAASDLTASNETHSGDAQREGRAADSTGGVVTEEGVAQISVQDRGNGVVYAEAGASALLMPDLRGRSVRDAARVCAQLGLQLEARGEGRVVRQLPRAGAGIEAGQVVRIEFGRSD
ncbi:MAG: PASTA domain-containing protein [Pyrinomonadaceae bacterium]|nr:PASTA domain-containing protein [Pyrinomonadaceae bacterium]